MNRQIAQQLQITEQQVSAVLGLLNEDSTIPFIARYRKERTGGLDEVVISNIRDLSEQIIEFNTRKESIHKSLEEQGILTDELLSQLQRIQDKSELEDFYLPYKPKRKTKASVARANGLEPLAKIIMAQNNPDVERSASRFINSNVANTEDAIQGALDIIAEWVNEHASVRRRLRNLFEREAVITSKLVKSKEEEAQSFQMYYNHEERIKHAASHRFLAMLRGENEGVLRLKIEPEMDRAMEILERTFIKEYSSTSKLLETAIKDAYKRLLQPSLQNEFKSALKEKADEDSIKIFAKNLKELLLAPPLKGKRVMAIDPGFRTGCKVVCLNENGDLLHNETIYPHPPQRDTKLASHKITSLADAYKSEVIAIGNGTAGKETEIFIRKLHFKKEMKAIMVNESGASVYSASAVAREEFPQYDVTVRGAVSIGRRLIDPLSELVKIDPKSIGVGQYQHDVDQSKLGKSLDEVVMSCVNAVGVDVNTASKSILRYVSGIGDTLAQNIITYRRENGDFKNRKQLLKVPRLGQKAFEQAAGFLRVNNGNQPLDQTAVHPESYAVVEKMAKKLGTPISELIENSKQIQSLKLEDFVNDKIGIPTLKDIQQELLKPGLDPRKEYESWDFDPNINRPEDLRSGMKLRGIVTNITAFGAFVDVGVHQDGLVHKSNMANEFVRDPNDFLSIGQRVMVTVLDVDIKRKRIQFSMKA
jgi:uncharacterized protein